VRACARANEARGSDSKGGRPRGEASRFIKVACSPGSRQKGWPIFCCSPERSTGEKRKRKREKGGCDARCVAGTGSWSVRRAPRALTSARPRGYVPRRTPRSVRARYARRTHREACAGQSADVAFGSARCRPRANSCSRFGPWTWTAVNQ